MPNRSTIGVGIGVVALTAMLLALLRGRVASESADVLYVTPVRARVRVLSSTLDKPVEGALVFVALRDDDLGSAEWRANAHRSLAGAAVEGPHGGVGSTGKDGVAWVELLVSRCVRVQLPRKRSALPPPELSDFGGALVEVHGHEEARLGPDRAALTVDPSGGEPVVLDFGTVTLK